MFTFTGTKITYDGIKYLVKYRYEEELKEIASNEIRAKWPEVLIKFLEESLHWVRGEDDGASNIDDIEIEEFEGIPKRVLCELNYFRILFYFETDSYR